MGKAEGLGDAAGGDADGGCEHSEQPEQAPKAHRCSHEDGPPPDQWLAHQPAHRVGDTAGDGGGDVVVGWRTPQSLQSEPRSHKS